MRRPLLYSACLFVCLMQMACSKGYQVRFTNYYTESMDSVVVGSDKVVFINTGFDETTGFENISKGKYAITFVSKSKKRFSSSITIPNSGSGKRTIQVDGIKQVSILEE